MAPKMMQNSTNKCLCLNMFRFYCFRVIFSEIICSSKDEIDWYQSEWIFQKAIKCICSFNSQYDFHVFKTNNNISRRGKNMISLTVQMLFSLFKREITCIICVHLSAFWFNAEDRVERERASSSLFSLNAVFVMNRCKHIIRLIIIINTTT